MLYDFEVYTQRELSFDYTDAGLWPEKKAVWKYKFMAV